MVTLLTDIQAKESKGLAKLIPKKNICLIKLEVSGLLTTSFIPHLRV